MIMVRWLGFAVGLALLLATASSVIKTLLIPRSAHSVFGDVLGWLSRGVFRKLTARVTDLRQRERILAASGPTWLVSILVAWLACLLLGYALLMWPLRGGGFPAALEESGSSIFTLGFIRPSGPAPAIVVFLAAASGLALVAMLIAYLPVLYAAFNRREIQVTTLEALAGSPPWGPELLARQALIGDVAYLPKVYDRWTEWTADISESHTNYRTLIYFRSPDPQTSWLLGLLAVLDAAALQLAFNPSSVPPEARPLLRVGYITMRRLAKALGLAAPDDPRPDGPLVLTREEFGAAMDHMRRAGWEFEREADEAWPHFRGWRVNYEAAAYALACFLDLPPAVWSGPAQGTARHRSSRCARRTAALRGRPVPQTRTAARARQQECRVRVVPPHHGTMASRRMVTGQARPGVAWTTAQTARTSGWCRSSTGGAPKSRTRSSRPAAARRCRNRRSRAGSRW